MPHLQRIGKDKVINHHHDVPFKVLEKQYSFGDEGSENMIIH
jgi:adenine-specific DNA-methyltransferase